MTLRDVAKRAGVSPATASFAMNNRKHVSPDLRQRVLRAIEELNYTPNTLARGLRTARTSMIGLIISDITNPFFPEIARGVEDAAAGYGYSVFLCNTDGNPDKEAHYAKVLRSRGVDGIIFAATRVDDRSIAELHRNRFPMVLINRVADGFDTDYVGCDNVGGTYQGTGYLVSLGHRRIAFIGGASGSPASHDRLLGYTRALESAGIGVRQGLIAEGHLKMEGGYIAGRQFASLGQDDRPTAIFAANDLMAIGAMDAVLESGLAVPENVAILGFDDIKICSLRRIQLSTVRQPRYEMGKMAVELLLTRLSSRDESPGRKLVLPCELVVRGSTGKAISG